MGVKQTVITTIICDRCGNEITDEERQKLADGLSASIEEKNDATRDMQTAQKKYAEANGFKVQ